MSSNLFVKIFIPIAYSPFFYLFNNCIYSFHHIITYTMCPIIKPVVGIDFSSENIFKTLE